MTRGQARQRVDWVDVAKGIAILLVAVHHAVLFLDGYGWLPDGVSRANQLLGTFRMPLFFLASGFFAGRTLSSSWTVVLRKRVLFFLYLYAVWVLIRFVFFRFVPNVTAPEEGHRPLDLLLSLVVPQTGLWFIYALAVFSVATKVLWRVPVPAQLAGAAVLASVAGAQLVPVGNFAWRSMAMYFVFFLIGCRLRPVVERGAAAVTVPRALLVAAAYLVGIGVIVVLDAGDVPGVLLVVSGLAVAAGVSASVVLAGWAFSTPLRELGRRTIDVYLPHVLVIAGATAAMSAAGWNVSPGAGALLVPGVALVAVVVSLALASALRRVRAGWLFELPRQWQMPSGAARTPSIR